MPTLSSKPDNLGIYSTEVNAFVCKKTCPQVFVVFIQNSPKLEMTPMSTNGCMNTQTGQPLLGKGEKRAPDTNMHEYPKHLEKEEKPDRKEEISVVSENRAEAAWDRGEGRE